MDEDTFATLIENVNDFALWDQVPILLMDDSMKKELENASLEWDATDKIDQQKSALRYTLSCGMQEVNSVLYSNEEASKESDASLTQDAQTQPQGITSQRPANVQDQALFPQQIGNIE